jgi:serine/threonine-protein kinase
MGAVAQAEMLERELAEAMRTGRNLDAAHFAYRLNRRSLAAELFERAGHFYDAAVAYKECGKAARAREAATRVPLKHPAYFAAARLAIELFAATRTINHDLEQFVASYLEQQPITREDADTVFTLGQLYEAKSYLPQAIALYRRVLSVVPDHPAQARLRAAEQSAMQNATCEVQVSGADLKAVRDLFREQRSIVGSGTGYIGVGALLSGRYRLEALLGAGSSGSVFKARDLHLSEDLALKLVDTFARGSTAEARFRREVSLARRLSHQNVVRIYDLAEHDGRNFLTMELLDGSDLRSHAHERRVDLRGRRDLLLQICAGLGYAHAQSVVHRDIKPENIFVTEKGVVKVTDFGMAKAPGDVSVTMTGSMGGTPYYMSPEQITDFRNADHRADLYALGVVAYELFTGDLPFESSALTDLLMMHLERAPESLRARRSDIPPALDLLVLKLLAKHREERFQSCEQVAEALRSVAL